MYIFRNTQFNVQLLKLFVSITKYVPRVEFSKIYCIVFCWAIWEKASCCSIFILLFYCPFSNSWVAIHSDLCGQNIFVSDNICQCFNYLCLFSLTQGAILLNINDINTFLLKDRFFLLMSRAFISYLNTLTTSILSQNRMSSLSVQHYCRPHCWWKLVVLSFRINFQK